MTHFASDGFGRTLSNCSERTPAPNQPPRLLGPGSGPRPWPVAVGSIEVILGH